MGKLPFWCWVSSFYCCCIMHYLSVFYFSSVWSITGNFQALATFFLSHGRKIKSTFPPKKSMFLFNTNVSVKPTRGKKTTDFMCVCVILQSEEDEKPDPFPSFRGWSFGSNSDCSAGITATDEKILTGICLEAESNSVSLRVFLNLGGLNSTFFALLSSFRCMRSQWVPRMQSESSWWHSTALWDTCTTVFTETPVCPAS